MAIPQLMRAVGFEGFGPPSVLTPIHEPIPEVRPNDLLVEVKAIGVNRADLNHRQGRYGKNPDFGDSHLLGLEIAGIVVRLGPEVTGFKLGDRVMGIVGGGGYAQYARMDAGMAMPVPESMTDVDAACVPEAFVTAHQALLHLGQLAPGEKVLVHGAGGGVGTALVQLALLAQAGMLITTSSAGKRERLQKMGVHLAIDYASQDFLEVVSSEVAGGAVDLIVDVVGGPNLERNVRCLRPGGRLIQIGVQGGGKGQLPVDLLLQRRLRIEGTVMKSVTLEEKRRMSTRFSDRWLEHLRSGRISPVMDKTFPLSEAALAHQFMEEAQHFGKIVLIP